MKQTGGTDHSGAIWVLGITLILAVMATSPYWQTVGVAVMTGIIPDARKNQGAPDWTGLLMTGGAFFLVVLLAGAAQANSGLGAVALMLLIGLWVWFLMGHTGQLAAFFALLSGNAGEGPVRHGRGE